MHKNGNVLILILAATTILSLAGAGYFYLQSQKMLTKPGPFPASTPTFIATNEINNWQTNSVTTEPILGLQNYQIKTPSTWKRVAHSSNFQNTETFQDSLTGFTYQLVVHQEKNINTRTGKPYVTLKEATGFPYDVPASRVGQQLALQVLPRAGSESDFMVIFFSKDSSVLFSVRLDTPRDGSKIQEGKILFDQILSTFKFTDQPQNNASVTSGVTARKIIYKNIDGWPQYDSRLGFSFQYPRTYSSPRRNPTDPGSGKQLYCEYSSTRKVFGNQYSENLSVKVLPYAGGSRRVQLIDTYALGKSIVLSVEEVELSTLKGLVITFKPQYSLWAKD